MTRRVLKKTLYAGGVGLTLTAMFALFVLIFAGDTINPSLHATPTPTTYQSIVIEKVSLIPRAFIPGQKRYIDVVATLRNPNAAAGIVSYPVSFSIKDSNGEEIATAQDDTYILPGTIQYAMGLDVEIPISARVAGVDITVPPNPQFIDIPANLDLPRFTSSLRQLEERKVGQNILQKQIGIVSNTSTFDWQRVEVKAVGLNSNGDIIAAGKTFVGKLVVGEQREFTIEWPKPEQGIQRVIALPATNMFRQDNIVNIIGDPSLLR